MAGDRVIFHIDANSAYLSWEAVYRLQHGASVDLREIPSVVGGDQESRRGIVLTKSIPAKKYGIQTGETLYSARQKCPDLVIVPPNYGLYMKCSKAMNEILQEYSPRVQRFSVDESFLEYPVEYFKDKYESPVQAATAIKDRIHHELGFTVNIGISLNSKLLAKMAGDLKKPNLVHTIWPHEIEEKMWPRPVEDLFMVGHATAPKLRQLRIFTIGDLAKADPQRLEFWLKSHGRLIWNYAHGLEHSEVGPNRPLIKGIGNSNTTPFDVEDPSTAYKFLLSLTEMVAARLRENQACCQLVAVSIRDTDFRNSSHQRKLYTPTDSTEEIYHYVKILFDELWRNQPLRHLGVRVSALNWSDHLQLAIFNYKRAKEKHVLDTTIDKIRAKYGAEAITRAVFLHSGVRGMSGGVGEEEFPMMTSLL